MAGYNRLSEVVELFVCTVLKNLAAKAPRVFFVVVCFVFFFFSILCLLIMNKRHQGTHRIGPGRVQSRIML